MLKYYAMMETGADTRFQQAGEDASPVAAADARSFRSSG